MEEDLKTIEKKMGDFVAENWGDVFEMWLNCILEVEKSMLDAIPYDERTSFPYTLLYEAGVRSGRRTWLWLLNSFDLEKRSTKEKTYYTDAFFTRSGAGELEFREEEGRKILRFKGGTFFARKQGVVERKVCYYVAGFIAGITSGCMKKEYTAEEIKCVSKGDRDCDFVVRPMYE